jgi:hypothetical protein
MEMVRMAIGPAFPQNRPLRLRLKQIIQLR